jgi:hypothetical protein
LNIKLSQSQGLWKREIEEKMMDSGNHWPCTICSFHPFQNPNAIEFELKIYIFIEHHCAYTMYIFEDFFHIHLFPQFSPLVWFLPDIFTIQQKKLLFTKCYYACPRCGHPIRIFAWVKNKNKKTYQIRDIRDIIIIRAVHILLWFLQSPSRRNATFNISKWHDTIEIKRAYQIRARISCS